LFSRFGGGIELAIMRAPPPAAPIAAVPRGVAGETALPQRESFPQLRSHPKPTARAGNILTIESTDPIFSLFDEFC
jgi:hypothetical protein